MKGVILDLDGVLRRGKRAIPGSVEAVGEMLSKGVRICYLTNNSTRSRETIMDELSSMGYPRSILISSAQAASVYISRKNGSSRCLVVGERGLEEELMLEGHEPVRAGSGADLDGIDLVVAGLDRNLDYGKVKEALWAIRDGAGFIATNRDPTLPIEGGNVVPGAGTTISAIETCSGTSPIVVGKPEPFSTLLAVEEMGMDPEHILMIGDRPDTDMEAGRNAGLKTAMVLTGDVERPNAPDFAVYKDLSELVSKLL